MFKEKYSITVSVYKLTFLGGEKLQVTELSSLERVADGFALAVYDEKFIYLSGG